MDQPAEHVAAVFVGAQPEGAAGRVIGQAGVGGQGVGGGQPAGEDDCQQQDAKYRPGQVQTGPRQPSGVAGQGQGCENGCGHIGPSHVGCSGPFAGQARSHRITSRLKSVDLLWERACPANKGKALAIQLMAMGWECADARPESRPAPRHRVAPPAHRGSPAAAARWSAR
ncbi:hypothetical protein D3C76_1361010 [compost metagenome]